ncbi:hypothetical protein ACIHEI_35245 [Kitasatospora sp. NPDC051984]|uniref:hypothetical protein n=1 Tax=Kitasatospora sp. NPDC051984 TaxID=3364059 RepID=UPI0037C7AF66
MNDTVRALLTPHGFDLLRHPTGRLARALRVADSTCEWTPAVPVRLYAAGADEQAATANTDHCEVCEWTPAVPVRLYAAGADEQAATANTGHCEAVLRSHGASAEVVGLGAPDFAGSRHLGSNVAATAAIVRWFGQLP